MNVHCFPIAAMILAIAAGCSAGPKVYPVTGTVAFEGKPVAEGEIILRDVAGQGQSWAGKIENGSFSLQATGGEKIVSITAMRPLEAVAAPSGETAINFEMYIPSKYNTLSNERVTITSGNNSLEFDLKP